MEPASVYFALGVALLCRPASAEWVEIPLHVKASGAGRVASTTARPAILQHSQLLSHLSSDGATSHAWTSAASSVRRPVSDLLDFAHPDPHGAARDGYRRVAMVNVSSKVEPWPDDGLQEEYDEEDEPVHTQMLPFGNRYEEESIEASTAAHPEHFDDFDDYDEREPVRQQHQPATAEYDEGAGSEEGGESQDAPQHKPHKHPAAIRAPAVGFGRFVEFLRSLQANFVLRTAHTIGDKIRTLAGLRDQLLGSIERRIAALWQAPGRGPRTGRRVKRGWMDPHATGAEAMDFPSAEGALLTISFLTFAVFLIKLVLQVINTIKAKHYTYSTFAAATPVSGGVLVKRVRRHNTAPAGPDHALPDAVGRLYPAILNAINSFEFT